MEQCGLSHPCKDCVRLAAERKDGHISQAPSSFLLLMKVSRIISSQKWSINKKKAKENIVIKNIIKRNLIFYQQSLRVINVLVLNKISPRKNIFMSNVIELELSVDKIRSLAQSFCICWLLSDMKYQAEAHCVYMRGRSRVTLQSHPFKAVSPRSKK